MKIYRKSALTLLIALLGTTHLVLAQKESCSSADQSKAIAKIELTSEDTSGCAPSSCRGSQTKFGEAKTITLLRQDLVALKTKMEQSLNPKFSPRSYDVHGIVGNSDDQSLQLIATEVDIIEAEFVDKTPYTTALVMPKSNKAKQLQHLKKTIANLHKALD